VEVVVEVVTTEKVCLRIEGLVGFWATVVLGIVAVSAQILI
jgi:hypothetical protein